MNEELDDFEKGVLRDFVAGHWAAFERHCKELGVDPQDIYVKLGGERDD